MLTGGSAATVWSSEQYQSRDCDFIITFHERNAPGKQALQQLGYRESGQIYRHPANIYTVEFPRGPLSVGERIIETWETLKEGELILHILTPTDSCCDRLAAYYHWNDYSSLKVAVAIGRQNNIDLDLVRQWSTGEGHLEKFEQFMRALNAAS